MELAEAIKALEGGANAAIVLQANANAYDRTTAEAIIRRIETPGGLQYAYHELYMGGTTSGLYAMTAESLVAELTKIYAKRAAQRAERYAKVSDAMRARMDERESKLTWLAFNELDLPPNLHP